MVDTRYARSSDAVMALEEYYRLDGLFGAQIDSVRISTDSTTIEIYSSPGERLIVEDMDVRVDSDRDVSDFRRAMRTRAGRGFVPRDLDQDIIDLLQHLTEQGAVLTSIAVDSLSIDEEAQSISIIVSATQTRAVVLGRIELNDDTRNNPTLVARIAELRPGRELTSYNSERIRNRLTATQFIRSAGEPEMRLDERGDLVVFIPIQDAAPGSFDLVLGYLPSTATGRGGTVVGNGRLELVNIFGGGRAFSLKLNRLPGQVASVEVDAEDPFIAGLPVGLAVSFDGYQQDSTYSRQSLGVEASYMVATGLRLLSSGRRETTRPGQAGLKLINGTQRIPRANAYFFGVGVEYKNVDYAPNPRRGVVVEMNLERGRSSRQSTRVINADTTKQATNIRQQRLHATSRFIIPSVPRQAIVLGADTQILISNEYRENDLFQFGGASSLRGYNEQQFAGRFVGRAIAEYRYQIDRGSYAFLFSDLGIVEVPATEDRMESRTFHPGFGVGIVFETAIGFMNATYAMNNTDGPANGRVHIGLSFGL